MSRLETLQTVMTTVFPALDHFTLLPAQAANDSYGAVRVGGRNTACLSRDALARLMLRDCLNARTGRQHHPKLVFASNGHTIALAARDEGFRAILTQADIFHADAGARHD